MIPAALGSVGLSHISNLFTFDVIQNHLTAIQQKLSQYFVEGCSTVDLFTIHGQRHRVRLEQIYVPLKLARCHKNPQKIIRENLASFTDILNQNENIPVKFVVLKGEPMVGKSTYVLKLCNDWAKAYRDHDTDGLGRFKLVLPLTLSLVQNGHSLCQTLKDQLDCLTPTDIKVITWLLKEEPERLMLILDGLDEFSLETSKELASIISTSAYPKITVVVTSREEGMAKISQSAQKGPVIDVEIQGFNKSHIKDYVKLYFSGNEKYTELIKVIFQSEDLKDMATNPGRLGILCLLWSNNQNISEDKVQLYTDYICILMKLAENKEGKPSFLTKQEVVHHYEGVLHKFGQLALKCGKDEASKRSTKKYSEATGSRMCMVFSMQEVESTVGKDAMKYGMLYIPHPLSRMQDPQVLFIHKTIQEWLAAFYIAHHEHELEQLQFYEYTSTEAFLQDTSLHGFLFSFYDQSNELSQEVKKQLFTTFIPHVHNIHAYLYSSPLDVGWDLSEGTRRWFLCNSKYFIRLFFQLYEAAKDMPYVAEELISNHPCACLLAKLLHIKPPTDLFELTINGSLFPREELVYFVKALGHVQLQAKTLYCRNIECEDTSVWQAVGQLLLKMPTCTQLDIVGSSLTAAGLEAILAAVRGEQLNIQTIQMIDNTHLQGAGALLAAMMHNCGDPPLLPNLTVFVVSSCGLDASHLQAMVTQLKGKQVHMKVLDLDENKLSGGGRYVGELMLCLSNHAGHDAGLCVLNMRFCELTTGDLHAIKDVIRGKQIHIDNIELRGNNFDKDSVYEEMVSQLRASGCHVSM